MCCLAVPFEAGEPADFFRRTRAQAARGESIQLGLRDELAMAQRDLASGVGAASRAEQRAVDLTAELRAVREVSRPEGRDEGWDAGRD